jgi:hypothetical protein
MAKREPLSRLQLPDDFRSDRIWILLVVLSFFVIVVSWLDWMF